MREGCVVGPDIVRRLRRLTFELSPPQPALSRRRILVPLLGILGGPERGHPGIFRAAVVSEPSRGVLVWSDQHDRDALDSLVIAQGSQFKGVIIFPKLF